MPAVRLRRLRKNKATRDWVSQTHVLAKDLIQPYFVVEGKAVKKGVKSMPGINHFSADSLAKDIAQSPRIKSVLLFGVPKAKDLTGREAYRDDGVVQEAIRAIKKRRKNLIVITDVCLCAYLSHGHCGIVKGKRIDNDASLEVLARIAVSHARAGADFAAPSAMMDGQVRAIRKALDKNGFQDTGIMAYSAKFASNFYGPFRDVLDSAPQFGDRKSYQMDFRNPDEALREIKQDISEGADIVMVKPALAYLDVIYRAKQKFNAPIAAYNVSGEYAMLKNLSGGDRLKEKELAGEALASIKRAGADLIITYWAKDIAK